jgi:hypothetical protein
MTALHAGPPAHRPAHAAPELAPLVADLFAKAAPPQRARLLNGLLRPVGPLALVAIAAGAFASLLPTTRWQVATASLDDAMRLTAGQVLELARYVEQKSPEALIKLPELLADSPLWVSSLGGALLLLSLQAWRRRAG